MRKITIATALLLASTALASASDFGTSELPKMHETFDANPARFAHDYVGKSFVSSLIVTEIVQNPAGTYDVKLNDRFACMNVLVDDAQSFNKGDTVNVTGMILGRSSDSITLDKCAFSRSVPVPPISDPAPPTAQIAPAPAPDRVAEQPREDPKIIYVQPAAPPQVIYVQPPPYATTPTEPAVPAPQPQPQPVPSTPPQHQSSLDEPQLPRLLAMMCEPEGGRPYGVFFEDGSNTVQVIGARTSRPYRVFDRHDNRPGHTLYIAAKRHDQDRTLYFAFDYSHGQDAAVRGNPNSGDVSAIRVKAPHGYDARDKCFMDWQQTAYE